MLNTRNENFPLKRFRDRGNLSQEKVAELAGISQSSVSRLEKKETLLKREFVLLVNILKYLKDKYGENL